MHIKSANQSVARARLFLAAGLAFGCLEPAAVTAAGAPGDPEEAPFELAPVVVVASKSPRPLGEVAGQVSLIDATDIERFVAEDLDDLLRYEPGVTAEVSGTRFGVDSINLRGIGGNRVAIEVDGVPVRNRFAVGSYSNAGRSLVETDRVKRLEILYGPASTLYGSDAIGGVLAFTTWDPEDLVAGAGRTGGASARAGYRGADDSWAASGTGAWAGERSGMLIAATRRSGHELESAVAPAGGADLQDWDSHDVQLRFTHDSARGHRLRATGSVFERDTFTRINSLPGYGRFRSTTELLGQDRDRQEVASLDYAFATGFWSGGLARIYSSRSETEQRSFEERAAARVPVRLQREFEYQTDLAGAELNLFRDIATERGRHRIGVGLELMRTRVEELRDGFQETLADGGISNSVLGEELPVRDFPVSVVEEAGVFVQDEIRLNERWELIPALRWDAYRLEPRPDPIYVADNPATQTVSVRESRLSPRLGLLRHWDGGWSAYAQYVQGFRAPPFEDANIGLDIPLFNIRAIPNPDLRSETSRGWEFGIRQWRGERHFSLALFATRYDDFIESRARIGVDPASGVLLFQSRNIDSARIEGLDLRFEAGLGRARNPAGPWSLRLAAFWARGRNLESDQPLNSISPPQLVAGLSWVSGDGLRDVLLSATLTRRQSEIDQTTGARFATPGYGLVDLTAGFRVGPRLEVRAGVFNIGDKTYWRWSDVSNLAPDDPMLARLVRPGRNYSVTLRGAW